MSSVIVAEGADMILIWKDCDWGGAIKQCYKLDFQAGKPKLLDGVLGRDLINITEWKVRQNCFLQFRIIKPILMPGLRNDDDPTSVRVPDLMRHNSVVTIFWRVEALLCKLLHWSGLPGWWQAWSEAKEQDWQFFDWCDGGNPRLCASNFLGAHTTFCRIFCPNTVGKMYLSCLY